MKKSINTNCADFLKSTLILQLGMLKNNLLVEEIGLPLIGHKKECRADIFAINGAKKDKISIYEIKSSKQDFLTDFNKYKYLKYNNYCNYLYFVVHKDLFDFVYEKLFCGTEENNKLNKHIGLYEVSDNGYLSCRKRASNTKNTFDIDITEKYLNKQLKFRYFKIHKDRFKFFRDMQNKFN